MAFGKSKEPKMVDVREVKHSKQKLWLMIVWLLIMLFSAGYCALSFFTLKNLQKVYSHKTSDLSNHDLWAVLTAAALTPALVILFFVLGTLLLIRKITKESGITYSLGLLHASTFWLMCIMMMTAVTLHAYIDQANDVWENRDDGRWKGSYTTALRATYIFAYILTACYLALFLLLFVFKGAMKHVDLSGPPQIAVHHNPAKQEQAPILTPTPAQPHAHATPVTTNVYEQPPLPANAAGGDYGATSPLAKV